MAGNAKRLIDELIRLRSRGKPGLEHFVRAHLVLSGIEPDEHTPTTQDDPDVIEKLERMIAEFRGRR